MVEKVLSDLFSLEGRTAIVTGALGLLGKEHCKILAAAGANVAAVDLDEEVCKKFASSLNGNSDGFYCNITSEKSVYLLTKSVLSKYNQIDILVNNAAINDKFEDPSSPEESMFENYPLINWQRSLDVNITGTFICCKIIGKEMLNSAKGTIINIASTYGEVAPNQSLYKKNDSSRTFYKTAAYPVTKAAVISLTKYLAAYWGTKGIRVNSLSPGGVENNQEEFFIKNYSERTPLGRMAKPYDYHGALLFLASDASEYMTGANLVVDGGWTIW